MKFETYLRTASIAKRITKDLAQARATVYSDHPKNRILVAFTRMRIGLHKGGKPSESPPGASVAHVSRRGVNARKIDMEFPRFSSKGVA